MMFNLFKKKKSAAPPAVNEDGNTNTHDPASVDAQKIMLDDVSCIRDPDDIYLASYSAQGYSDGKRVHIGMYCFYHKDDQTVYLEEWGPGKHTVVKHPIPDNVSKTKEDMIKYLEEEKRVFIPTM